MSNSSRSPFRQEATLEELAGVGRNRRFDEIIDDEGLLDLQVICRRGEEEIPLANPSRAIYFGDRGLYNQEANRFVETEKARILNTAEFSHNLTVFNDLKLSCQRGFVIPFVGAGMSKTAGCPTWAEYLLDLCVEARRDPETMRVRLEEKGDYEGVMDDLVRDLGENRFNRNFKRDFKTQDDITGAVTVLPRLFDGSAITTNFDRVLEKAYENASTPFIEKVTGRGNANMFFRALPAGDRYLLRLHGYLDNAAERILNKAEYDVAYGNDGVIDFERPLPKLLRRLFTSYSFLFIGCSLSADRTVQTFMRVVRDEGADNLPSHYALLPCPADPERRHLFDQRLADALISPLWDPEGSHEHVEQILELLLE